MEFVRRSKYQSIRSCCGEKSSMNDGNECNELQNKSSTFPERKNKNESAHSIVNVEPLHLRGERYYDNSKLSRSINKTNSMYQSYELPYGMKNHMNNEDTNEESFSPLNTREDKDFWCPRCGKKMQEPRLLPCLHPICSPCVSELMSKPSYDSSNDVKTPRTQSENRKNNYCEICPLCEFQLPNANSPVPPPHYPLQHRLVMNAIRYKFANKILCDICTDEVVAVVQCSTCLRNFCLDCGMEHQRQITMELKPSRHLVRPLWEATKVRRTALCLKHPTHALRFYCVACQQVTCKECMWSSQHRGHASESAVGAGKRVTLYLTRVLQKAKTLLNMLLTQYDRNAFLNGTLEEMKDISSSIDYRYVKLVISFIS
ncbi:unnamed protein product [Xylocopa violacea]|uniref:Tripartite motif-containing protein 45 n=2 Tax=Xylocopa violacea TaxID=135666 RepID=A0ABP1P2A2_XYLVO